MDLSHHTIMPFALIVGAFTVKQFLADFPLQTNWMARGKERGHGWLLPLTVHATVHGGLTLTLALIVAPGLWWFGVVDFAVHGLIDRSKTVINRRMGWTITDAWFWTLFGFDQSLHHMTGLAFAVYLVSG